MLKNNYYRNLQRAQERDGLLGGEGGPRPDVLDLGQVVDGDRHLVDLDRVHVGQLTVDGLVVGVGDAQLVGVLVRLGAVPPGGGFAGRTTDHAAHGAAHDAAEGSTLVGGGLYKNRES